MRYKGLEGYESPLCFKDISAYEAASRFDAGESFALFASFELCPWCNAVIALLNDAALESGSFVYHMNTRTRPDQKRNSEMDGFSEIAERFELEEDADGQKQLAVPHVFFVRGGKVVYEVRGGPSGAEDPSKPLEAELAERQKLLYLIGFKRLSREKLKTENGIRLNDEFLLFTAKSGERMLVPTGGARERFKGLIAINEIGSRIVELLGSETSEAAIVQTLFEEYDAPIETLRKDVLAFLNTLREARAIEEAAAQ